MKWIGRIVAMLVFSGLAVQCNSQTLTRAKAAELINKSEVFRRPAILIVPVGDIWWDQRDVSRLKREYHIDRLVAEGILSFQDIGKSQGIYNKEYVTSLTVKGIQIASRWNLTKEKMPNGTMLFDPRYCYDSASKRRVDCGRIVGVVYSVVVGYPKVKDVTGIAFAPGHMRAEVDFTWEFVSTPEAHYFFPMRTKSPVFPQRAELQLYDDGWRVIAIAR